MGDLSASDEDSSSFTYSLVSGSGDTDNGKFQIQGNQLLASQTFSSGEGPFSVRIRVNDGTDTFDKVFAITVFDGPRIDVLGKGIGIPNGDSDPTIGKDTDFGSVNVGQNRSHTFEITTFGSDTLNPDGSPRVVITGAGAGDFTVIALPKPSVLTDTDVATFTIQFSPSITGLHYATVSIDNNTTTDDPPIFTIQGTGVPVPHIAVVRNQQAILNGDTTPRPPMPPIFATLLWGIAPNGTTSYTTTATPT